MFRMPQLESQSRYRSAVMGSTKLNRREEEAVEARTGWERSQDKLAAHNATVSLGAWKEPSVPLGRRVVARSGQGPPAGAVKIWGRQGGMLPQTAGICIKGTIILEGAYGVRSETRVNLPGVEQV